MPPTMELYCHDDGRKACVQVWTSWGNVTYPGGRVIKHTPVSKIQQFRDWLTNLGFKLTQPEDIN